MTYQEEYAIGMAWLGDGLGCDLKVFQRQILGNFVVELSVAGYITWILHESEASICKAFKGEAIVAYADPLITPQMKASGLSAG